MDLKQAFATFVSPPREFGPIPFWFLNDDLEEGELLRQLRALHEAHYGGFVLHARVGLSRRVGYLTEEFFRLARLLVAEAARLGMKVILYDEGSYPSGSAQGAVVAENPDYASRAMGMWERTLWRVRSRASGVPIRDAACSTATCAPWWAGAPPPAAWIRAPHAC